jgi:hypothetical protein
LPRLLILGALALLAACRGELAACETASCRQAAALSAWSEDPVKGMAAIEALPTEIERSAAVARLMEAHPSQISQLCGSLPEGKLRVRCQRTAERPHLWEAKNKPIATGLRAEGGPRSHRLAPEAVRESRLAHVSGDLGICRSAPDPHTCAWARAMELGAKGQVKDAAAKCAAITVENGSADTWQAECRFSAAEAMTQGMGAPGYGGAAELCLSSGEFQERCLIHLARDLAARTPAADRAPGPALQVTIQAAEAIERFWGSDPAGPKFVAHFWSVAMGYAFLRAESVTGDLVDAVPAEVLPHIHAAAAWRFMQIEPSQAMSLDAWSSRLDTALLQRAARPPGDEPAVHMPGLGNLWDAQAGEGQALQARIYMGMGRRAAGVTPAEDKLVCLLEAAARQTPVRSGLLEQGRDHPALSVRWTAKRLLSTGGLPAQIKPEPSR